jgi:hypothetical protein
MLLIKELLSRQFLLLLVPSVYLPGQVSVSAARVFDFRPPIRGYALDGRDARTKILQSLGYFLSALTVGGTPGVPRKGNAMAKKEVKKDDMAPAPVPAAAPKLATPGSSAQPAISKEEIAKEAYYRWVKRGRQHGKAMEDWVEAEKEVKRRKLGK